VGRTAWNANSAFSLFFGNALHLLASSERLPQSNFGNTVSHILTAKLFIPDPFSGIWNQG